MHPRHPVRDHHHLTLVTAIADAGTIGVIQTPPPWVWKIAPDIRRRGWRRRRCRPVKCRCRRRPVAGTARRRAITPLCPHLPICADDPPALLFPNHAAPIQSPMLLSNRGGDALWCGKQGVDLV